MKMIRNINIFSLIDINLEKFDEDLNNQPKKLVEKCVLLRLSR